jgi:hypothetical protein
MYRLGSVPLEFHTLTATTTQGLSTNKGKGNPVTGPGGPIGWVEVSLNSLTSALEGGEGVWSTSRPGCLYPRQRPGTHCTGGWVGPGAGLDWCGKSRPTGIRSPDLPVRSESLYRLRHPGSNLQIHYTNFMLTLHNTVIRYIPLHVTR